MTLFVEHWEENLACKNTTQAISRFPWRPLVTWLAWVNLGNGC